MRKGRFSEAQIVAVLHEFDGGAPGEELARRHGMHANTIRLWRSKYAGMSANDLAQLKQYGIKRAAKIHSRRGSTAYETFARLNVRTLIIGLHSSRAETEFVRSDTIGTLVDDTTVAVAHNNCRKRWIAKDEAP
ncbi:MAG: transposase [Candidatus Cybelea sp.]